MLCLVLIGLILPRKKFRSLSIGFVRVMASMQEIFNLMLARGSGVCILGPMKANAQPTQPIKSNTDVKFKPEFQDEGDAQIRFVTVGDEILGRVMVMACIGLPINPTQVVPVEWLEKA